MPSLNLAAELDQIIVERDTLRAKCIKMVPREDLTKAEAKIAELVERVTKFAGILSEKDAEIDRLEEREAALKVELACAGAKLRDRAHPASDPRDPPEVLRTLGHWPDCGCGECYAIHLLDQQMARTEAKAKRSEQQSLTKGFDDLAW